jgi:serine/threonine-protein kinase
LRDDPYFSRYHFLLELQPPRCYLRDLGSHNGTLVNGHRVQGAFLKDGDVIGGGKTRLRVAIQPAGGPTATADVACLGCGLKVPAATTPADSTYLCPACQALVRHQAQHVPGYEIVRKLGQGNLGVVYLARRRETGLPVALKLIVPESASEQAVQWFLREVSVLRQLDHPRIVRFHEAGTVRGQFFFAMDYIETVALKDVLRHLPRPRAVQTMCAIVCQALEGLRYAHRRSFVHRDVKPANLLLSRTGTKLRTWLADFGLAMNYESAGLSGLTRHSEVRGSLAFMAPEQVLDCRHATPAVDLYGAGATLYYLLAEQTPHDFAVGRDPYAVVLEEEVVPLEQRVADLPAGLATVVHKALARNPAERFASAAEMRRALRPYARGEGSGTRA